jgi:hypothetical protein
MPPRWPTTQDWTTHRGEFTTESLGGKSVLRGTTAMVDQTAHVRGLPYLYNSGDVRYVVVTDDPAWGGGRAQPAPVSQRARV